MAKGRDNPGREKSRVADQSSLTGRLIVALVRMYKTESEPVNPAHPVDDELLTRIDKAVAYLYRRGGRTGRHRAGRYVRTKSV